MKFKPAISQKLIAELINKRIKTMNAFRIAKMVARAAWLPKTIEKHKSKLRHEAGSSANEKK